MNWMAFGGGFKDRPSSFRVAKTPRWIGELEAWYARPESSSGCVTMPGPVLRVLSLTSWKRAVVRHLDAVELGQPVGS